MPTLDNLAARFAHCVSLFRDPSAKTEQKKEFRGLLGLLQETAVTLRLASGGSGIELNGVPCEAAGLAVLVERLDLVQPAVKAARPEQRERDRLSPEPAREGGQKRPRFPDLADMQSFDHPAQGLDPSQIGRIVTKGTEKHAMVADQMAQKIEAGDPFAFVGRIGNPVTQEHQGWL